MRVCPACGEQRDTPFCPLDGAPTDEVAAAPDPWSDTSGHFSQPHAWHAASPARDSNYRTDPAEIGVDDRPPSPTKNGVNPGDILWQLPDVQLPTAAPAPAPVGTHRHALSELPFAPRPAPAPPNPHRHAVSQAPFAAADPNLVGVGGSSRAVTPSATRQITGGQRAMSRASGGWGDDLFGDLGKPEERKGQSGPVAVTSQPRPHAIPDAPVVPRMTTPPTAQPAAVSDDEPDRRSLVSTLLVVAVVCGALYVGGTIAFEKLQQPATSMETNEPAPLQLPGPIGAKEDEGGAQAPAPDGPDPLAEQGGAKPVAVDGADSPLVTYVTTLSAADKRGKKGRKLKHHWQIVVRDRERVHSGRGDAGDEKDGRYRSAKARAQLGKLIRARRLPDAVRAAIRRGSARVSVRVWQDYAGVSLQAK